MLLLLVYEVNPSIKLAASPLAWGFVPRGLFKLFSVLFKSSDEANDMRKGAMTFLVFVIIYLLSADLDAIAVLITKSSDVLVHTQKTGYAILWGISSFVLMLVGMKHKEFRALNIKMIELAEKVIYKFDKYDFR